MDKNIERIVIGLAFVVLAALVIANVRTSPAKAIADLPAEDYDASLTSGPLYLMGNMPWAYAPWSAAAIPQSTAGQNGQVGDFTQAPLDQGNCYSGNC